MIGRWAALALTLAVVWMPPAATGAEAPVVLVADPWCPHTCDPAEGSEGYMIEIAREAFGLSGIEVIYKTEGWSRAMRDVRLGRADGAVGALFDEAPDLVTHAEPLGMQVNVLVTLGDDSWHFEGWEGLAGRRVGAVSSYSYSAEIDAWLKDHPSEVQMISGSDAALRNLKKLMAGRIDVMLDDEAVVGDAVARLNSPRPVRIAGRLPGGSLHIALNPKRGERLAQILNRNIRALRASGRLATILERYDLSDWGRKTKR
ncbi:putative ABC transporter, periplasmic substrate-binding protein [Magnetospirillum sp. LM-5]|uniref:substrate-binding periplasmic protein n=1 Tax=Magnetospirillum sp. LM-5 TaxID=2681466 RepID=UPI001383DF21|nr:transporter substrate-binding domain-containing protein [Magnetospirillum sp. LM-5]CAA7612681.1 putative ABC transporter, periplasmic substrate-binding protein [Magnetospirillum sp. LM-5]